jgi:putative transposase
LLHHSDRGSQYASNEYQALLSKHGMLCSINRKGDCWDNAVYIESFNGKPRDEGLNREILRNGLEAQIVIESWRQEYNNYRPHSSLGYLTPEKFAGRCAKAAPATGLEEVGIDILQTITL